jgi:hypothetical protein
MSSYLFRPTPSTSTAATTPHVQRRAGGVYLDPHLSMVRPVVPQTTQGCQECLEAGSAWLHLRLCLTCGHVGCCDSSPMRHARRHALGIGHPIVRSFEPGEDWRWCYVDDNYV